MSPLPPQIESGTLPTALAPMQNVTDRAFMKVIARIGPPDYFFTEYFSVHSASSLDPEIIRSIEENETGRPVFAQVLGNDSKALGDAANQLERYPIAGVDLNLGCPAPKIYKRNAGGGLLRAPDYVDHIIGEMRDRIEGSFSVKCRIGFSDTQPFSRCLRSIERHKVNFLTVHGRTVKQMYRGDVDYLKIREAVERLSCPVLANGNLSSAERAREVAEYTGSYGSMIGRGAVRNPWIFRQVREHSAGKEVFQPTLGDVAGYIDDLNRTKKEYFPAVEEKYRIAHLKRYLIFIAEGVDPEGQFLHEVRRVGSEKELFSVCEEHLLNPSKRDNFFANEPFPGVIARPNCE
ncbi:MAG: tRNA-dihydrouridine synthase family protein [Verrucomicrobiota bacterium]